MDVDDPQFWQEHLGWFVKRQFRPEDPVHGSWSELPIATYVPHYGERVRRIRRCRQPIGPSFPSNLTVIPIRESAVAESFPVPHSLRSVSRLIARRSLEIEG